jgi:hypothetical protein
MAETPVTDDEIYGEPNQMLGWSPRVCATVYPARDIQPAMAEGVAFKAKDTTATAALVQFMKDVNLGIRAYNNTVYATAHLYLNADEVSADELRSVVAKQNVVAREVTP